jgi:hypothetical protein
MSIEKCRSELEHVHVLSTSVLGNPYPEFKLELSFKVIEELIALLKKIPTSELEIFSASQIDDLTKSSSELNELFASFRDFLQNPRGSTEDPFSKKDELVRNVLKIRNHIIDTVSPLVVYATLNKGLTDVHQEIQVALKNLDEKKDRVFDASEKVQIHFNEFLAKAQSETTGLLATIQDTAAKYGVTQQSNYFQTESTNHKNISKRWLITACLLFLVFLSLAIVSFCIPELVLSLTNCCEFDRYDWLSTKYLVFFTLGSMILLSVKNYNGHKHNEVVNKHRQNALMTYEAMAAATKGKGTHDIVLAYAAACIYSPQESGFAASKNEAASSKSVLELLTKSSSKD